MFSEELLKKASACEAELKDIFDDIDRIAYVNTEKVMKAFSDRMLSERHFMPTCGYGYNDDGRDRATGFLPISSDVKADLLARILFRVRMLWQ